MLTCRFNAISRMTVPARERSRPILATGKSRRAMKPHRPANIAVAICTYRRNEPLRVLLRGLVAASAKVEGRARVGIVLVDDSSEGLAYPLAQEFADRFSLGLHYRRSGQGNISIARNIALDTALEFADWIA